ncbi:YdcF family protein [Candidatus Woesearchaeota archaeon]|nr:YdcF family protein [Candidatus Woesearchaeota archaeon]
MEGIIVILGSPNDDEGNLSDISTGRIAKAIQEYRSNPDFRILCTGGFGDHFNRTDKPHATYAVRFLIKQGIPEEYILEIAESHDTVEDALKAKPIIDKYNARNLIIVSSDFHMERVKYIFERIFSGYNLRFAEAQTDFSEERYNKLYAHENKELRKLKEEGIPGI